MSTFTLRHAHEGELPQLADLAHRAFRIGSSADSWRQHFAESPYVQAGDVVAVEVGGKLAGCAASLAFEMSVAGARLPMGGVAAVAVRNEYRRRGIADAMMRQLLRDTAARRVPLSVLHPFSARYYTRFGYARSEANEQLRAAPSQFPPSKLAARVEPMELERDLPTLTALYEASRENTTGPLTRNDWWWRTRVLREGTDGIVFREPGTEAITGYALFVVPSEPGYPQQEVSLREVVCMTPAAHAGLFGWVAALGDQFRVVRWMAPTGTAQRLLLEHGLADAPPLYRDLDPFALTIAGMMARLVDIPAALEGHPSFRRATSGARFGLDLHDPLADQGTTRWDVAVEPGGVSVKPGHEASNRLVTDIGRMTQLYLRSAHIDDLVREGTATASPALARTIDALTDGPPMFLRSANYF